MFTTFAYSDTDMLFYLSYRPFVHYHSENGRVDVDVPKPMDYIPEWVWEYSHSHGTTSDHHKWLTTRCRTLSLSGAWRWRGDSAKSE